MSGAQVPGGCPLLLPPAQPGHPDRRQGHLHDPVTNVAQQVKRSGAEALLGATQADNVVQIYEQAKAIGGRLSVAPNATGYSSGVLARAKYVQDVTPPTSEGVSFSGCLRGLKGKP
jgi:ABC-type branched-subunit amino acid transport system substrate-binding protein